MQQVFSVIRKETASDHSRKDTADFSVGQFCYAKEECAISSPLRGNPK